MLTHRELSEIARMRVKDATALLSKGCYEGAIYLCGYAVELALKARAVRTLKWSGFPSTTSEFSNLKSFQTHNLETLLKLAGWEAKIKGTFTREWSDVGAWHSELRYQPIGTASRSEAETMLDSSKILVKALL